MNRLEKLKRLEEDIYNLMQKANSRTYSSLAKQYRETIREIEEIEGSVDQGDEIAQILAGGDGVPGAVRKNRTEV